MPRLSRLRVYPIKSCRGYDLATAHLDSLGMAGDRRYQVVGPTGKPFTQRNQPRLARVTAVRRDDHLHISSDGFGQVELPLIESLDRAPITTEVWSTTGLRAAITSPEADRFFSDLLGTAARLVQVGALFDRPVKNHPNARVGFADSYPLLVISEASLDDLNDQLIAQGEAAVTMERFRPNLVITDCLPRAEDQWDRIRIADTKFQTAGPCERCIMTTLDPATGERLGPEPLRTLAQDRRAPSSSGVNFGQNLVHLTNAGTLTVGDNVEVLA